MKLKREWCGEMVRDEVSPSVWSPWRESTLEERKRLAKSLGVLAEYERHLKEEAESFFGDGCGGAVISVSRRP